MPLAQHQTAGRQTPRLAGEDRYKTFICGTPFMTLLTSDIQGNKKKQLNKVHNRHSATFSSYCSWIYFSGVDGDQNIQKESEY